MANARIFEELKADHDRHREMLATLADSKVAGRETLFEELRVEVTAHAAAEEQALYANMLADPELRDEARHSVSEHKEIDDYFAELAGLKFGGEAWEKRFKEMRHRYEHHINEEEEDMFPAAAQKFSAADEREMAKTFEERKPDEIERAQETPAGDDKE